MALRSTASAKIASRVLSVVGIVSLPGRLASEPAGLVHEVSQRAAGEEAPAVVEQDLEPSLVEIGAETRRVRRDEHTWRGPEWMLGRQRLVLEDVQAGAGQLAGAQRGHQVVEPGGLAPPDVDEVCAALHPREPLAVHEPLGGRR